MGQREPQWAAVAVAAVDRWVYRGPRLFGFVCDCCSAARLPGDGVRCDAAACALGVCTVETCGSVVREVSWTLPGQAIRRMVEWSRAVEQCVRAGIGCGGLKCFNAGPNQA